MAYFWSYWPDLRLWRRANRRRNDRYAQRKRAVECGYWHLFRFDPKQKELGEHPFHLDSKKPTAPLREFLAGENRFRVLNDLDSESAREMLDQAEKDSQELYALYEKLASS